MQLLAQEEYGLRCLLQVARHAGPDPLTIPEIAESEGLSPEYAAKLMRALRRAELVASTRGAGGGYRLARPANEITAWQVVRALGGSIFPQEFCESHPGQRHDCVHSLGCSIRGLWGAVEGAVRGVLDAVTIAELARVESTHLITRIDTAPSETR
ncbi:MAG TPA: Rrf2 family transcriptional regulator [Myxococcota bacterium]|jgi:Rrf2 family protein|nr:Rrf2 family transcriptional regulator [Myxococcota bacterium]